MSGGSFFLSFSYLGRRSQEKFWPAHHFLAFLEISAGYKIEKEMLMKDESSQAPRVYRLVAPVSSLIVTSCLSRKQRKREKDSGPMFLRKGRRSTVQAFNIIDGSRKRELA